MAAVYVLGAIVVALMFLVLRNRLRHQRADSAGVLPFFRALSPWEEGRELKPSVKKQFMFWGGVLAGITSAALTHQLDVMKCKAQLGQPNPDNWHGYMIGITMGSVAQGARFGVTLLLNATLQKKLDSWEAKFQKGSVTAAIVGFLFSALAGGVGEAMTNPFGVIKNYQVKNEVGMYEAIAALWAMGGIGRFFNGIGFGVLRKSAANGIMLQSIGPCKTALKKMSPGWLGGSDSASKSTLGFIAGSLTGAFAEVMTNHPDQVKTMTQTGVPLWEALCIATSNPFRGSLAAGIRKGAIRGINWGCLEFYMGILEGSYRKYRKAASPPKVDKNFEATGQATSLQGA